jgi:SAM-dependent methyltransferase
MADHREPLDFNRTSRAALEPCCPSCSGDRIAHLDSTAEGDALISGCRSCGLVFRNPMPAAAEIVAWYEPGGGWDRKRARRAERQTPEYLVAKQGPSRPPWIKTEARALHEHGARTVLHYGCGEGGLLDALRESGWDTFGIDPNVRELADHELITTLPATACFDLIIMKHVIEHLPNPLTVFRQARRALSNGGHLFVACPTLDGLRQHGRKQYVVNRQHVTAYTARSLRHMLAVAGFRPVRRMPSRDDRMAFIFQAARPSRGLFWPLRSADLEFLRMRLQASRPRGWMVLPVAGSR